MIIFWDNLAEFEASKVILQVLPGELYMGTPSVAVDGRACTGHNFTSEQLIYIHNLLAVNNIETTFGVDLPSDWVSVNPFADN